MRIQKANKTLTLLLGIIMLFSLFSLFPVQVMAETDKLDTVYWNMDAAGGDDTNDRKGGDPHHAVFRHTVFVLLSALCIAPLFHNTGKAEKHRFAAGQPVFLRMG